MAASILIVDDDAVARRLVENMVQKCGYETLVVESGDVAIAMLTAPDAPGIDAVVLDLVMPGLDGMGVLAKIREAGLSIPVVVQTAHGGIDNVVSAMRAGAQDFVVKPVGIERLQVSLRNALNTSALKGELQRIRHSREGRLTFADIITRSETMAGVLRTAQKAAASTIPVLIEGESGVGKELFARAIHGSGERKSKPFVAVNCGAIPDNLVESILFGHEKGAFILLRHNFSSPVSRSICSAARTSRQGSYDRVDQADAHGCDRVRDVAFRPQWRIPLVYSLREGQASGRS